MEFAAQMTCQKCVDAISNSLHGKEGISESYSDAMVCFTCFNNWREPKGPCPWNWLFSWSQFIILCMCFIERRTVTSHTHGSKISGSQQYWSSSNNWPWQQQESLDWQNNNLFTSITQFCPFLNHHCTTATWSFFILLAHFLECVNIAQKNPFSFLNLDMVYWIQPEKILPVLKYLKN